MVQDVSKLISQLNDLNNRNTIDVPLYGTRKTSVRKLTVGQLKRLILPATEDLLSSLEFQINLFNVLQEIAVSLDFDTVNYLDKNSIIFSLKLDETKEEQYKTIVDRYDVVAFVGGYFNTEVVKDGVKVVLRVPSLAVENKFNLMLRNVYGKGVTDRKNYINDTFTIEIAKFVKSVEMGGESVDFSVLSFEDVIKVVNGLTCLQEIQQFITKLRDDETKLNTVNGVEVSVSPALFI